MGKIRFAKSILDFSEHEIRLLKEISEFRNIFAHRPDYAFSTLENIFDGLSREKKKNLVKLLNEFHLNKEEKITKVNSSHISKLIRNCCEQIISSMRLQLSIQTMKHHHLKSKELELELYRKMNGNMDIEDLLDDLE